MPKLKVFCATSGFHDSIVAAPSKPAALKAWGARTDLFSMGAARLVTDPKIARKALERPGEVIRLKRGGSGERASAPKTRPKRNAKPPSRAKLESAEEKLAALRGRQAAELDSIERELKSLEQKRDHLTVRHSKALSAAERRVADARDDYEAAIASWEA